MDKISGPGGPQAAAALKPTEKGLAKDPVDAKNAKSQREIAKVAEDFEALFLDIVLKSMRDSVHKTGLLDGGHAEEIYGSLLDHEYAQAMASRRQTGIADNIEKYLLDAAGLNKNSDREASALRSLGQDVSGRAAYGLRSKL